MNCFVKIHDPANVPAASMAPGTKERELLKAELEFQKKNGWVHIIEMRLE